MPNFLCLLLFALVSVQIAGITTKRGIMYPNCTDKGVIDNLYLYLHLLPAPDLRGSKKSLAALTSGCWVWMVEMIRGRL